MKVANAANPYYVGAQYQDATNLNARINLHRQFSTNPYGWQRWVFDQFVFLAHSRVLEIGCGPGDLWLTNAHRLGEYWQIILSDLSPGMTRQTRHRLANLPILGFSNLDAQAIPFPDQYFDGVIANHMLYHVPDRAKALGEIRRVLKPSGRFYATTIGATSMQEIAELPGQFDPVYQGWREQLLETFTLENGAAQLQAWFKEVNLRRYPDSLRITQAAPLVDYILSGRIQMHGERRQAFLQFIEAELKRQGGVITITKDSGIFLASH